jgi:hypothetical protein
MTVPTRSRIPSSPAANAAVGFNPGAGRPPGDIRAASSVTLVSRVGAKAVAHGAVGLIAGLSVLLLLAACTSSPPTSSPAGSPAAGGANSSSLVAYATCIRSHGVSSFPDPDSSGSIPKKSASQLGVTDAQLQAAQGACQHLLPNGGNGPSQAQLQQERALGLRFASCMRAHGVALPDPDSSGRIPDPASVGIDQGSPQFQAANQACRADRPAYMPSNAAYNAWAQSHNG